MCVWVHCVCEWVYVTSTYVRAFELLYAVYAHYDSLHSFERTERLCIRITYYLVRLRINWWTDWHPRQKSCHFMIHWTNDLFILCSHAFSFAHSMASTFAVNSAGRISSLESAKRFHVHCLHSSETLANSSLRSTLCATHWHEWNIVSCMFVQNLVPCIRHRMISNDSMQLL